MQSQVCESIQELAAAEQRMDLLDLKKTIPEYKELMACLAKGACTLAEWVLLATLSDEGLTDSVRAHRVKACYDKLDAQASRYNADLRSLMLESIKNEAQTALMK